MCVNNINDSINFFLQKTRSQFDTLKQFLKREFVQQLNKLEEDVRVDEQYLSELLNTKNCLLEVQQRFYEMR